MNSDKSAFQRNQQCSATGTLSRFSQKLYTYSSKSDAKCLRPAINNVLSTNYWSSIFATEVKQLSYINAFFSTRSIRKDFFVQLEMQLKPGNENHEISFAILSNMVVLNRFTSPTLMIGTVLESCKKEKRCICFQHSHLKVI